MKKGLTIALCLVALPIAAHTQTFSPRGQWSARTPTDPTYGGTFLIDAERRVMVEAAWDPGQRRVASTGLARSRGYVEVGDSEITIILTNGSYVDRTICAIESTDLLHCRTHFPTGKVSAPVMLTRVGPGPKTLMPAPR